MSQTSENNDLEVELLSSTSTDKTEVDDTSAADKTEVMDADKTEVMDADKTEVMDADKTEVMDTSAGDQVASTEVVVAQKKSLVILIQKLIDIESVKSFSIELSKEELAIIHTMVFLNPNTLIDAESILVEIIKDGRINSDDVPKMIAIIQMIYQWVYSQKQTKYDMTKRIQFTKTILKLIVRVLVKEDIIHIDKDTHDIFLRDTDLLIDSCVGLLQFSKSLKPKKCIQRLFK